MDVDLDRRELYRILKMHACTERLLRDSAII
jgi:hypothetical protein